MINRYLDNTLLPGEQERLESILAGEHHDEIISALLSEDFYSGNHLLPEFTTVRERNFKALCNKLKINNRSGTLISLFRAAWLR